MNEFLKRLSLPSPSFFKKVQWIGGVLVAVGGGILAIKSQYPDAVTIGFLAKYARELMAIGGTIALIGKLPVADPSQLNK
ncbi:MAG TPA: hypothetical protein VFM18_07760 [Methanosarcina sp.]|nr:hypothetical protein [Methanosarcina sp.]